MEADPVIHRCIAPDGVELAYRQFGEGRPLILVHGFSSDSRQWIDHGLAAAFAAPGHRVVMPDLRGHGASGRGRGCRILALATAGIGTTGACADPDG